MLNGSTYFTKYKTYYSLHYIAFKGAREVASLSYSPHPIAFKGAHFGFRSVHRVKSLR